MENGGPGHAELGRYVPDHCLDRRHFGLRRYRRRLDRNRQDHLLYRGGAVPGLRRGRPGARPHPRLAKSFDWSMIFSENRYPLFRIMLYFEGIATLRPTPSGRATDAWAFVTASMRARISGGNGAVLRAFMSM